jgi:ABC-type histidine transport system ATPase subunit
MRMIISAHGRSVTGEGCLTLHMQAYILYARYARMRPFAACVLCASQPSTFDMQIGIVGRTGSGKTTLLMALFRMIELAGGRILVDGLDIARLPLREARTATTDDCVTLPVMCYFSG